MPGTRTLPYVCDQIAMETGQTTWNRGALIARSSVDPQAGRLSTANTDEIVGVYYGANPANAASVFAPDTLPEVVLWGSGIPMLVEASATIAIYDYLTPSSGVTDGTVRTAAAGEQKIARAMTEILTGGPTKLVMAEFFPTPGAGAVPFGAFTLQGTIADVSTAGSTFTGPSPYAGTILSIRTTLQAAITVANANLTFEIGGTVITGGNITIAFSGSAPGDVDSSTPTAANTVTAGQPIEMITDGGSTTAAGLDVLFLLQRTA